MRIMVAIFSLCLCSTAAFGNPIAELVTKALKVFGVGHEAAAVERAAASSTREAVEKAAKVPDSKVPIHGQEVANASRAAQSEMDFSVEPKGALPKELENYKRLRASGRDGDVKAVLDAHRLAKAEHITETGEPYYGYWLFWHLSRPLEIELRKSLREEVEADCRVQLDRRKTDLRFDAQCRALPIRARNDKSSTR